MRKDLVQAPLEGEFIGKNEIILGELYPTIYVDLDYDCGATYSYVKSSNFKPDPKPTFWQRVKNRPWPYILFGMQMFWPTVLVIYAIFFRHVE